MQTNKHTSTNNIRSFEDVANPYCRLVTAAGEEWCKFALREVCVYLYYSLSLSLFICIYIYILYIHT